MFSTTQNPTARGRVHAPVPADGGDITPLLNAWLPTVPTGATVVFPPSKTYTVSAPGIKCLTMKPGVSFDFSGCTLAVPAGFFHVANQNVLDLAVAYTQAATTATMALGQTVFTMPATLVPAVGDLVVFTTSTPIPDTSGAELVRWTTRVVAAAGQVVTLDHPAPTAVTLSRVDLVPSLGNTAKTTIRGLRIDMSACPTLATLIPFLVIGLQAQYLDGLTLDGCQFIGADSACVAVAMFGCLDPVVRSCSVAGFHALPGFQTVSGKLGYGFQFVDCNQFKVVDCTGFGCRHIVALGGYMAGSAVVEHCVLSSDPAKTADMVAAIGVLIDCHEGHAGTLVVENCTISTTFAGIYARGRNLRVRNNRVKLGTSTARVVFFANERSLGSVVVEDNEVTGAGAGGALVPAPRTNTDSMDVSRNRMDGGTLLAGAGNIPSGVVVGRIRLANNIMVNAASLAAVGFVSGSDLRHLVIEGNHVTLAAAGTQGIFVTGATANTPIGRVEIRNNTIDVNATAAAIALDLRQFLAKSISITDNSFYGDSVTHGGGAQTWLMDATPSTDGTEISGNKVNGDFYMYSAAVHPMPRLSVSGNRIRRMFVEENNAGSPFGTGQWDFSHNKFGDPGYGGQGLEFRASSGTFWSDTESSIIVTDNQFETTGGNAVVVNAGHTNNRIVFRGNMLGAAVIADATNVNYSTTGNYTTGAQNGRGSTFGRTDGWYDFNAPTSGTWAIGDKVWRVNPPNGAGTSIGFVCVAAGTPGTWRSFGVTV